MGTERISWFPYGNRKVMGKDLDFKIISENWNIYELEDGTRIKVRVTASKITLGIDPETSKVIRLPDSDEPLYNVRYNVMIVAEVPKELMLPSSNPETRTG